MTALPICFSTLAFPGVSLAEAVAAGRDWGYAGVELRLIDGELIDPLMPSSARTAVRRTLATAGLPVVAVDSSVKLTSTDPGPELGRFLELASDWEAPLVRVFGGPLATEPGERAGQLSAAARVLERAAEQAGPLGVAIGVETHDDFAASRQVAELLALVDADPAQVGAVWDSHHPVRAGEQPAEVLDHLAGRIRLAQVKDARRRPDGGWQLTLLGAGELPLREMIGGLLASGYTGWLSVEWEKHWHPEIEPPEIALPQHLEVLTSWLQEQ